MHTVYLQYAAASVFALKWVKLDRVAVNCGCLSHSCIWLAQKYCCWPVHE